MPRPLEEALENPDNFKDSHQADETWFLLIQSPFYDLGCTEGLLRIVLREVA